MPSMTIHQFEDFVATAQTNVAELYREIHEVQEALNDAREATRLARQDAVEAARSLIAERRASLDVGFTSALDARIEEQRHSLEAEVAALRELVAQGEAKSAELLGEARAAREMLRALNPELDAQEEALKREIETLEATAQELDRLIARKARWFGMFTRRRQIRELARELSKADERIALLAKKLGSVRKRWEKERTSETELQSDLQAKWQENELRVARLRQDLAALELDVSGEAERRALLALVQGEEAPPPTGDPEADRLLAEVNRLSDEVIDRQEQAIRAGAQMLAVLSGLGEALDGFRNSVRTVREEQDAHSELPRLVVQLPDSVIGFHAVWERLTSYVLNEKQMAAYPGHFYNALQALLDQSLTNDAIDRMFTEMGNALSDATANWTA